MASLVAGCGVDATEPGATEEAVGELASPLRSFNGMLPERIDEAMLRDGRLTRIIDAASKRELQALVSNPEGRQLIRYVAGCSRPAGSVLRLVDRNRKTWGFRGGLGLGAAWLSRTLTVAEREAVSACLEAHTNAFGIVVPMSLRGPYGQLKATADEKRIYPIEEAAFYGDVVEPRRLTACAGKGAYDPAEKDNPYMRQRVCGRGATCGLTIAGPCGPYDPTAGQACERTGVDGHEVACHDDASTTASWASPIRSGITSFLKKIDLVTLWALVHGQLQLPEDCRAPCDTLVLQDGEPRCLPCPTWRLTLDAAGVFSCRPQQALEPEEEPLCPGRPPAGSQPIREIPGDDLGGGDEGGDPGQAALDALDAEPAAAGCATQRGGGGWVAVALVLGMLGWRRRRA